MAVVEIPDEVRLFVLRSGPVLHGDGDFDSFIRRAGCRTDEHVSGIVGWPPHVARLDAHLQTASRYPPGSATLAHPRPAFAKLSLKIVLEQHVVGFTRGSGEKQQHEQSSR